MIKANVLGIYMLPKVFMAHVTGTIFKCEFRADLSSFRADFLMDLGDRVCDM